MPTLALNKKAKFDYEILEEFEAGLQLNGCEVKSAKAGQVSFLGSFISLHGNEAWLKGLHISPYKPAGKPKTDQSTRDRKLLLHKQEIKRLIGKSKEAGLTLVPISLYTKGDLVKLGFGIARGKKQFEKRESIKKREIDREIRQSWSR